MLFQSKHSVAYMAATTLVITAQPFAQAANSALGHARYDAQRHAIVVPYTGAFPDYTVGSLDGPPRVYFDFNAAPSFQGVHAGSVGHSDLSRWAMARHGAKVRVTLTFNKSTRVVVLNDTARREVVLMPQGPGTASSGMGQAGVASAKGASTGVHTSHFHQTFGVTDFNYAVGPRPKNAKHDQVNVTVGSNGRTDFHVVSDPAKNFVSFSITIQGNKATIAPTKAKPKPKPKATPIPTPSYTPMVEETPTPGGEVLPLPMPSEVATATPTPTPSATPTPEPSPSLAPLVIEAPREPGTIVSLAAEYVTSVNETSVLNNPQTGQPDPSRPVALNSAGALLAGADLEQHLGPVALVLGLKRLSYSGSNPIGTGQNGQAVIQNRDEYDAHLGVAARFTPWGTDELLGVGYMANYFSNYGTSSDPTTGQTVPVPPSSQPSLATTPTLLFHGPTIFGRLEVPLFGPLGFRTSAGVAPYVLNAMGDPSLNIGPLYGYWATPALYLRFGSFEISEGFEYVAFAGTSYPYSYNRMGAQTRLDWRF